MQGAETTVPKSLKIESSANAQGNQEVMQVPEVSFGHELKTMQNSKAEWGPHAQEELNEIGCKNLDSIFSLS